MEKSDLQIRGGIWILMILHGVMLGALFTKTVPHPPLAIPLFALAPFLGAVLAIGGYALVLVQAETRSGYIAALFLAALSLISFGPQKLLAAEFSQIWPAVILGLISSVLLVFNAILALRSVSAAH